MMAVAPQETESLRILLFDDAREFTRPRYSESSLRLLLSHTRIQASRVVRRMARDTTTVFESLVMPAALLFTLNLVLGKGISELTGQSALYASVPMAAMVGAMTGSTASGVALMRERTDGLLSRLWVLPVHRASGLLSRFAADAVRILLITVVILCVGLALGFRFRQGVAESVAWLFVPTIFGLAFGMLAVTLALYAANTTLVEAMAIVYGLLMFFSSGFMPLSQFPRWLQPAVEHQPLTYAIEAMRGLSLGGPVLSPMTGLLLWAGGAVAVCLIPMAYGYRRASRRG